MNHSYQRNKLLKQLKEYKDFVPFCGFDDLPKLLSEITKIHNRIQQIGGYSLKKLLEEVPCYYETKQSKLN